MPSSLIWWCWGGGCTKCEPISIVEGYKQPNFTEETNGAITRFHQNMNVVSRSTEASWLCLLLSHDVSSALQPDISARPVPGLPQAPLLDKRPAIIAHFKDATHSKTAFMHLFWQAPVHSPFLAFSPFHLPPPYPSFLLSHQPSSLFRWAIKERNKCKSSLVWHRWLLTHSLLKYLLVFLSTKFEWSGYQQRWGEVWLTCVQTGSL